MQKMILTRGRVLAVLFVLCVLGTTLYISRDLWLGHSRVALAPHQALYDVRLSRLSQSNSLAAASGQMTYKIEDACDGWNVAQKFNLIFVYTESPSAVISSDYNTYESKDGRHYQFSTRRTRANEVIEEILGRAERNDRLGGGRIEYQKPKSVTAALPTGAMFPTQNTMALLQAAMAGDKWYRERVFDGSDLSIATDANSFIKKLNKPYIGKIEEIVPIITAEEEDVAAAPEQEDEQASPRPMTAEELNENPLVKDTRAWRIRTAFFAAEKVKEFDSGENSGSADAENGLVPDYEMTMVLHSNGLVSHFTLDYSDFSLDARLLRLAPTAGNHC